MATAKTDLKDPENVFLSRYNGDWGQGQMLHLLRRNLFGVTHEGLAFLGPKLFAHFPTAFSRFFASLLLGSILNASCR
jgi:hypothetical protein